MNPRFLQRELDVDPLEAAARWSRRPGTVLLVAQRAWHGASGGVLLIQPRWTLATDVHRSRRVWQGSPPPGIADDAPPWKIVEIVRARLSTTEPREGAAPQPLLAGWIGYDEGSAHWGALHPSPPPFRVPTSWIGCYDAGLRFGDGFPPRLFVRDLERGDGIEADLEHRLDVMQELLLGGGDAREVVASSDPLLAVQGLDPDWHRRGIESIHRELQAGNCYQINLTGFASARSGTDPFDHFREHGEENPVPFAAFLRCDEAAITCHSPERLLLLRDDLAETAPIKGTLPAGEGSVRALHDSAKDRAEHLMIVDLCRNDLARRAIPGSVRVESLMESLSLRGLDHLISRIQARPRHLDRPGLFASLFPGGSITGAPKESAMAIIRRLESSARGPYTGSIGWVDVAGEQDWNIAIRTAVWQDDRVHFGCGGGIVLDSDPDREFEEAALKAHSFFDTLRRHQSRGDGALR